MRKPFILLLVLLLISVSAAQNWTMDGHGGVYWTNGNGTIAAYPAVSNDLITHVQYFNTTYSGASYGTTSASLNINGQKTITSSSSAHVGTQTQSFIVSSAVITAASTFTLTLTFSTNQGFDSYTFAEIYEVMVLPIAQQR